MRPHRARLHRERKGASRRVIPSADALGYGMLSLPGLKSWLDEKRRGFFGAALRP